MAAGFLRKADVAEVLREQLGLSEEEVGSKPLDVACLGSQEDAAFLCEVWLTQLVTMKKEELKTSSFMSSLRPALPQKEKRRVLTAFKLLQGPSGSARLGDWLQRLDEGDLKQTVIAAFGAEDEVAAAGATLTEQVFLELFSDLAAWKAIGHGLTGEAPFMDVGAMLE